MQGAPFSPLLFNLYMRPVVTRMTAVARACGAVLPDVFVRGAELDAFDSDVPPPPTIDPMSFLDDLMAVLTCPDALQQVAQACWDGCAQLGLELDLAKCAVAAFPAMADDTGPLVVEVDTGSGRALIPQRTGLTVLGLALRTSLDWDAHNEDLASRVRRKAGRFRHLNLTPANMPGELVRAAIDLWVLPALTWMSEFTATGGLNELQDALHALRYLQVAGSAPPPMAHHRPAEVEANVAPAYALAARQMGRRYLAFSAAAHAAHAPEFTGAFRYFAALGWVQQWPHLRGRLLTFPDAGRFCWSGRAIATAGRIGGPPLLAHFDPRSPANRVRAVAALDLAINDLVAAQRRDRLAAEDFDGSLWRRLRRPVVAQGRALRRYLTITSAHPRGIMFIGRLRLRMLPTSTVQGAWQCRCGHPTSTGRAPRHLLLECPGPNGSASAVRDAVWRGLSTELSPSVRLGVERALHAAAADPHRADADIVSLLLDGDDTEAIIPALGSDAASRTALLRGAAAILDAVVDDNTYWTQPL